MCKVVVFIDGGIEIDPWEVIVSSNKCPERKEDTNEKDIFLRYSCKLSGGTCKEEKCPKKPGPEDY